MHRIDGPGATVDGKFTEGDPVGGVQATVVTDDFLNDVQEELVSILTAAGVTPTKGTQDQVLQSLYSLIQAQKSTAFTTAGTSTSLTLTPTPAIQSYTANLRFTVKFSVDSGLNPTLNVSSKGGKSLKQYDSLGAKVPAVFTANQISDVLYDGTDLVLMYQLPSKTDLLNTVRLDVASSAAINLTTAAPNTRNINITGSTGVTSFVVSAGQLYFVRFDATLTLTNSAGLVTNRGANITTAAGDTCIIRATAANTVEILSYVENPASRQALAASGWCKLDGGLIMQWGTRATSGTSSIAFPTAFADTCYSITAVAGSAGGYPVISSLSSTSFSMVSSATDNRWIAVGK